MMAILVNCLGATGCYIATRWNNGRGGYFHGWLDDIRIYNIALNASQVDSLYHETTTSIVNTTEDPTIINVYPNPVKEKLHIDCNVKINLIEIYNTLGKLVYFNPVSFYNNYDIEIKNLEKGIYLLKLNTEKNTYTKEIIVN